MKSSEASCTSSRGMDGTNFGKVAEFGSNVKTAQWQFPAFPLVVAEKTVQAAINPLPLIGRQKWFLDFNTPYRKFPESGALLA